MHVRWHFSQSRWRSKSRRFSWAVFLGRSRIRRATLAHHGRNAPNALPLGTRTPGEISGALQARLNTLLDPPFCGYRYSLPTRGRYGIRIIAACDASLRRSAAIGTAFFCFPRPCFT